MIRTTCLIALISGLAGPAVAQCATEGLRTRCIYVGPDDTQTVTRSDISARFVAAPLRNSPEAAARRFKSVAARQIKPLEPTYADGDTLPMDVLIMMNPLRHGLPRPRDGWAYFMVDREIYRADLRTRRVLDFVNPHIALR